MSWPFPASPYFETAFTRVCDFSYGNFFYIFEVCHILKVYKTAGSIDLKLCAYVSLGEMTLEIKFRSDSWLGPGGQNRKCKKCYDWIISKFSKDTWHNTHFFIWPTFQGHRGQSSPVTVTAGAIDLKLCTYCTPRSPDRPNFGPIWFLAWPSGGQNRKHKKCYNSSTNGWIISKFLS
jgi:hypothetical protein